MSHHKKQTYDRGIKAESVAAFWLQIKGYKILARRYKTPVGEIDLIARKGNVIAFIEVKARMTRTQALESVTPAMRRRIGQAAAYFCGRQNKNGEYSMRFDVMTVTRPNFASFFIHHLDNAWQLAA